MSLTLRHLNADTSWLILFENFTILLDPWLFGSQSEFCRYFSTQEHAVRPSIQNINRDLDMQIDAIIISHEFTDHCPQLFQYLRPLMLVISYAGGIIFNMSMRFPRWMIGLKISHFPC